MNPKSTRVIADGKKVVKLIFMCILSPIFFSGKSKLQRHRIINELLHDDIKMIHALSLSTKTSDEVGEIE